MASVIKSTVYKAKRYSAVQRKTRKATNGFPSGPSSSQMDELAQLTFSNSTNCYQIMGILKERLLCKEPELRPVLKALEVLDHCVHKGSESVVHWSRKNIYLLKTLRRFTLNDRNPFERDVGKKSGFAVFLNIRLQAMKLCALILDDDRLRAARAYGKNYKHRVARTGEMVTQKAVTRESQSVHNEPLDEDNPSSYQPESVVTSALPPPTPANHKSEASGTQSAQDGPSTLGDTWVERDEDDSDLIRAMERSKIEAEYGRSIGSSTPTNDNSDTTIELAPQSAESFIHRADPKGPEMDGDLGLTGSNTKESLRALSMIENQQLEAEQSTYSPDDKINAHRQSDVGNEQRHQVQTNSDLNVFLRSIPSPLPALRTTPVSSDVMLQQSIASRLNDYSLEAKRVGSYTDADLNNISNLLRYSEPRWSRVPRTYVVLRSIGNLDLLDHCIEVGFSDYWFPVTKRSLPDFLRPTVRAAFVEAQELILTKSMDLEKGERGQHCHFRKGESLPFEMKCVLGRGGYGQVDRVLSLISFKEYARKRVLRSAAFRGRKKEDIKQFIAEIEILKRLKHHHVVEFVGSYTDAKYIGLIMSPIAEGDLGAYLARATPANYPELRSFFGCLATALEFLHEQNVRHKDIKPGNILVSNGKVLFADFGLSLDFTDATGSTTMSMVNSMTPRYCAPEVAMHGARNTMSDIWSLGVVFLEMIVTLKGKTTQYMDEFFTQHGAQQVFIRVNTALLSKFMAQIVELGQWRDNRALEWARVMLMEDQKLRPTASALVTAITAPIQHGQQTGFCGICCAMDEEEDFSDYASE